MLQYDRGEPVVYVGRERELSVRSGLPKGRLAAAVAELIRVGKLTLENGALSNGRATKELEKIFERIRKNAENSFNGGEATKKKWEQIRNDNNGDAGPTGQPTGQPKQGPSFSAIRHPPSAGSEANASAAGDPASPPADQPSPPPDQPQVLVKPTYLDAKHELWGEGRRMLGELGIAQSRCGALIGGWCKECGDDYAGVLDAIARAREFKPIDPIPWIVQALPKSERKPNGKSKSVHDAARELTREVAAMFGGRPPRSAAHWWWQSRLKFSSDATERPTRRTQKFTHGRSR